MNLMLFSYKCGMTRVFKKNGISIPVTLVKIYSNYVVGIRKCNDIFLIKIAACEVKNKLNKSLKFFYKNLGLSELKYMLEFKVNKSNVNFYKIGTKLDLSKFKINEKINLTGNSKGKGFSGVIKRHNFKSQGASHGNSLSHNVPGSIGQCQTPGRVFKGKKMAGRLGNDKITIKNIEIIDIYNDLNVLALKGSLPGFNGNNIILKKNLLS